MKIWCDVCTRKQACVFCSADEAALCDDCDLRVHQANKLASKHQRFSLFQPSSSQAPRCDICQEKKALWFCQQDRAILCRDCDVQIHTANELTQKHNRFLLTGAKLYALSSKTTAKNLTKVDSANSGFDPVPDFRSQSLTTKRPSLPASSQTSNPQLSFKPQATANMAPTHDVNSQLTSSISEYLIEMLPGWKVEDLLDSCSDPVSFCKDNDDDLLFLNTNSYSRISSNENTGLWVPRGPAMLQPSPLNIGIFGVNEVEGAKGDVSRIASKKIMDDGFTVPQISPKSVGSKRSRPFC